MKKNKMIAALAVTAMVMCAVAPANVVYATEVTEIELVDESSIATITSAEDVASQFPTSIKLEISEYDALDFTGGNTQESSYNREHLGLKQVKAALMLLLEGTDYEVLWTSYYNNGIGTGYDLNKSIYLVSNKNDLEDTYQGTIEVEYTNNSITNAQGKYEAAYAEIMTIMRDSGDWISYLTNTTNYKNAVQADTGYFNKYISDSDVDVRHLGMVVDEGEEGIGSAGLLFFYVGDECLGVENILVGVTEDLAETIIDGITFVGGIGAKISAAVLEATSDVYKMMAEAVQAMGYEEIFSAHEFTLEEGNISDGITITFNVGTKNNGREAIVLHQLQNGEFEEFKAIVSGGVITAEVSELSPFVVALGDEVEGDIVDGLDDEPQTGEGNFGFLFYTACLALGAVLLVKRKEA